MSVGNEKYAPYQDFVGEWWFDDFRGRRRGPFLSEEACAHQAVLSEEMWGDGDGFDDGCAGTC